MGKEKDLKLLRALQKGVLKKGICIDCGQRCDDESGSHTWVAALQLPCVQPLQRGDGRGFSAGWEGECAPRT